MSRAGTAPVAGGAQGGHATAASMAMAAPAATARPHGCISAWASRAKREVLETSAGAHSGGFSCRAASARATLLPAVAVLTAGMQVLFVSASEKFIRQQRWRRRGNRGTVPVRAVRK